MIAMIYLSLGSNLGDREESLKRALDLLKKNILSKVKCSPMLATEAIVPPDSPQGWNKPYLNMVIKAETRLSPEELLQEIKNIEKVMGRNFEEKKWAPRTIDIDILLWEGVSVNTPDLKIPHPELKNRPFFEYLLNLI
jgi:2-amino-4-hydroxy-6-hydroxymethyldihydropteridine diphosphokinase/dihydropteroate synthase